MTQIKKCSDCATHFTHSSISISDIQFKKDKLLILEPLGQNGGPGRAFRPTGPARCRRRASARGPPPASPPAGKHKAQKKGRQNLFSRNNSINQESKKVEAIINMQR